MDDLSVMQFVQIQARAHPYHTILCEIMHTKLVMHTPGQISVDDELTEDAVTRHEAKPQLYQITQARKGA